MRKFLIAYVMLAAAVLTAPSPSPSDHADPIDVLGNKRLEPGITDLFVFPVDADGKVVDRFERTGGLSLADPDRSERERVDSSFEDLIVILCVRRGLVDSSKLRLDRYAYTIHMDLRRSVSFSDEEHRVRYGGHVEYPEKLEATATIELRLNRDGTEVSKTVGGVDLMDEGIEAVSGKFDDPFILPMFFRRNVVAMALKIPAECFPEGQENWIVWATSKKGGNQIDHVGRSSRTQNPRFELLNKLHPSRHVAALHREDKHPSLMRDISLRAGLQSLFQFREWDFVPDVQIYSRRYPVGFPNGRLLEDDVAAILAQFGDTLLYELSFNYRDPHPGDLPRGGWPRATTNDKTFQESFPYLATPWPDPEELTRPHLRTATVVKLFALITLPIALLVLLGWYLARWHESRKHRVRYL